MKFATIQPCTHRVVKQTISGGNCIGSERLVVKCASKEVADKQRMGNGSDYYSGVGQD